MKKTTKLAFRPISLRPLTSGELADVQGGYLTVFACAVQQLTVACPLLPNTYQCTPLTFVC